MTISLHSPADMPDTRLRQALEQELDKRGLGRYVDRLGPEVRMAMLAVIEKEVKDKETEDDT